MAIDLVQKLACCGVSDDSVWQAAELRQLWEETGEAAAWEFCAKNELCGIMTVALTAAFEAGQVPARWTEEGAKTQARLTLFMAQLDRVASALAGEGIRLVALKNSGIARGIYPHLAACPMGDIDVLVDSADFRRAHACMLSLGFQLNSRSPLGEENLEEAEQSGGSEYEYILEDGSVLWFELQWRPVAGRWIRPDQEPPAKELLARSVEIPDTMARLLAPEDNLMQVCLHTAKHSYVRAPGFRLHTDVDRIVRRCQINWDLFVAQAESMGVRTAVYLSLTIPTLLLRTPVPSNVLDRLNYSPRKLRFLLAWINRVGLFDPSVRKWSKVGFILFNLLLYDTLGGVLRGIFPPRDWMYQRYGINHKWTLPWWYLKRLVDLIFKRAKT